MAKPFRLCPETGVKYRIRRQSSWRDVPFDKRICSIEVSLDNSKCSGRYLETILRWTVPNFPNFVFSLGDTLRIHDHLALGGRGATT